MGLTPQTDKMYLQVVLDKRVYQTLKYGLKKEPDSLLMLFNVVFHRALRASVEGFAGLTFMGVFYTIKSNSSTEL